MEEIKRKLQPFEKKESKSLTKHSEKEKKEYIEEIGRTTILKNGVKHLKRIADNMDAALLISTLSCALWAGVKLGKKDWIEALFPLFLTFIFGMITYVAPKSPMSERFKDITKTIIGKK